MFSTPLDAEMIRRLEAISNAKTSEKDWQEKDNHGSHARNKPCNSSSSGHIRCPQWVFKAGRTEKERHSDIASKIMQWVGRRY